VTVDAKFGASIDELAVRLGGEVMFNWRLTVRPLIASVGLCVSRAAHGKAAQPPRRAMA